MSSDITKSEQKEWDRDPRLKGQHTLLYDLSMCFMHTVFMSEAPRVGQVDRSWHQAVPIRK